ncbi:MAG: saccharopine dehydrogenase C-terminal domain-containing protein [Bacteroidales bacterium]
MQKKINMKKILVLGAGMVGKAIAVDLCKNNKVTSVDLDQNALKMLTDNYPVQTRTFNVTDNKALSELVSDFDFVISAVPGHLGYETLKTIIEAGKDVVDISFMPEDFMDLKEAAASKGVTAIADCGVAPGMPNLIAGYYNEKMKIESLEYVVGGLPKERRYPFYYKAPFSPVDVIEEYTRPARYKENDKILVKPAMSDVEMMEFDKVGTLEAFFTDGLRSLLDTLDKIPNMKEKTLRYPGHIELMKILKKAGFFSDNPVSVNNTEMSPLDFTSKILIDNWKLEPDEHEFTVMRIIIDGLLDNKEKRITYELYDEYDTVTALSSMARTTGFTATACAELVLEGIFDKKGVYPLELIGAHEEAFFFIIDYLKERNVIYNKKVTDI